MRTCIFMMQKDEGDLLSAWIAYHSSLVDCGDIYILDNGSKDPATLSILDGAKQSGVNVLDFPEQKDFESKGAIIARLAKDIGTGCYIPIDCDEFLFVLKDAQVSASRPDFLEQIGSFMGGSAPVGRIGEGLWNVPGSGNFYNYPVKRVVIKSGVEVKLDLGFHLHNYDTGVDNTGGLEIVDTGIGVFHFHNRPFYSLVAAAKRKMAARIPSFSRKVVAGYKGNGAHLLKYFTMSEREYLQSFTSAVSDHSDVFRGKGLAVPFEVVVPPSDEEVRLAKSPVNEFTYRSRIVATPDEIGEIHKRMLSARKYIEFGAGGTTSMACEAGVQSVTSIETSLDFCAHIVEKYALRPYLDTGRLRLHHFSIGDTKDWGYPIEPPSERVLRDYQGLALMAAGADLALVDGRYRVSSAAALFDVLEDDSILMVHDYFSRPKYHVLESIYSTVKGVGDLVVFKKIPERRERAKELQELYLNDPS